MSYQWVDIIPCYIHILYHFRFVRWSHAVILTYPLLYMYIFLLILNCLTVIGLTIMENRHFCWCLTSCVIFTRTRGVNLLNVCLIEHTLPVMWITFQLLFKLDLFNTIFKDNINLWPRVIKNRTKLSIDDLLIIKITSILIVFPLKYSRSVCSVSALKSHILASRRLIKIINNMMTNLFIAVKYLIVSRTASRKR